jgi:hypothetical protein
MITSGPISGAKATTTGGTGIGLVGGMIRSERSSGEVVVDTEGVKAGLPLI